LICEDGAFGHAVSEHLEPHFFQNEALSWAYSYCKRYESEYGGIPSVAVLLEQTRRLDPKIAPLYQSMIEQVKAAPLRDDQWMRASLIDFVKRNIFVKTFAETRTLFNNGKVDQAYDLWANRSEKAARTNFDPLDREWFFEELPRRQSNRMSTDPSADAIGTGLPWLDKILNGGLSIGELGIWIGEAKSGKSTMLVHLGKAAVRLHWKAVLHIVLEGSRKQVADRYDSAFMDEFYTKVKFGDITFEKYRKAWEEFQILRHKLVIRGFTERWDYSCVDIHQEIKDLKTTHGWTPELVIVDYGDLLMGRNQSYKNETEKQQAAFRDLKSLSNRGFGVWTASQSQRPKAGDEHKPRLLVSSQIADCYGKVRVADFVGSVNSTPLEREAKVMRALAEMYRDNEAGSWILLHADFPKMTIAERPGLVSPSMSGVTSDVVNALPKQQMAPV
jgi:hypothetical protein